MATQDDLIDAAVSRRVRPIDRSNGQIFSGGQWRDPAPPVPRASRPAPISTAPKFTVSPYVPPSAYENQPTPVSGEQGRGVPQTGGGFNLPPAFTAVRSADDLVASAIAGRRNSLAAERNSLITQLNSLPAGRGSAARAAALKAQLGSIESQDRTAAHDARSHAFEVAHQTTLDHKNERDIQSAQQHTALVNGLDQISKQFPIGTADHAQAVLDLRSQIASAYPLGKLPKEGVDLLKAHSATHDDLATQIQRAKDAGFTVTGFKSTKDGGVDVAAKPTADLTDKAAAQDLKVRGLTPDMIQNPVSVQIGNVAYDKSGKAIFTGASDGAIARIDTGNMKKGMVDIPVQTYLKHGGQLSPADAAAQQKAGRGQPAQPQSAPAATDQTPQLAHYDFRTPTGAFGHDLPANLPAETVNQIASAYSLGDHETGTRLAQAAMQPQPTQVASSQPAAAAQKQLSPADQAALNWARTNQDDPRAKRILELNQ